MRKHWRPLAAVAVALSPLLAYGLPSSASSLPSGSGVVSLINESFDSVSVPTSVSVLTVTSPSAAVPCVTTIVSGAGTCSKDSGVVDDAEGGQLLLTDASGLSGNASGILVKQSFLSTSSLYAEFESQSYGGGGASRTLWLIDASAPTPNVLSGGATGGYGGSSGGVAGGVLGITFDAVGSAALANNAACPSNGWDSSKSSADQVVIRSGDTSSTRGLSGFCFVASTNQKLGALGSTTKSVGPLHQSDASNGWQHFFVSVIPPSFTNDLAHVTVAVDAADGRGLQPVLDVALPTWAWDTATLPSHLKLGISAAARTDAPTSDVMSVRNLRAVSVAPQPLVPSAPRNVGVQWSSPVGGFVNATISWSASAFNGYSAITKYVATLDGETCQPSSLSGPTMSCVISRVPAGDTYTAIVTASNAVGDSLPTSVVSTVNAQSQTITFATLPALTFGGANRPLSATASSGLPVAFAATGSCSLVGTTLQISSSGLCSVTATQSGTQSYSAATPVVRTVVIAPQAVTIKVLPVSAVVDGAVHPVTPLVTPSTVPLDVKYCSVLDPTQCSTIAPSTVGAYVATVKPASNNYSALPVSVAVAIAPDTKALPVEAGGPQNGTNGAVQMQMTPPPDSSGTPSVLTQGSGFTPGSAVNIAVTGQETLGSFTVPSPSNPSAITGLLAPSTTNTGVQGVTVITATSPSDLSQGGTIAFPFGGFPGSGSFFMVTISSSGFIPGSTVSSMIHSTPIVVATAVADSNGVVTLSVPIPGAFAGQAHKLVLAGTYLASTTTANADGTVTASTAIPSELFSRLEPDSQLIVTAVDESNPSNFAKSYINIGAAVTTTTIAGSANDALQAPPLVPTDHPQETMKQVTNLVAVAATVAATASVAASVAGSVRVPTGGASTPRAGSGGGSSGSSGPLSTQQIGTATDEVELIDEGPGDRLPIWRTPGHRFVDRVSAFGPKKIATVSPMVAASVEDGSYLRAILGSTSLIFPIVAAIASVFNAVETHGYPAPGHVVPFAVMIICGALDGWAGLAATLVTFVAGVVTGHMFSLPMLVSLALMAAMLFGTGIIVKQIRPLVRPKLVTFQDKWERAGDLVIAPLFGGFLSSQLVAASASAAGLQLPVVDHAAEIGVGVGVALFLRYVLATVATHHFPRRLAEVTVSGLPEQSVWAHRSSHVLRQVFTALLLQAFLGWSWVLAILVALQIVQSNVANYIKAPTSTVLYRIIPRGIANMFMMAVIGTVGARVIGHFATSGFWQVAGLLILMTSVNVIYAGISTIDGDDYPVTWATRIAGVIIVVITGLQLTGHLI